MPTPPALTFFLSGQGGALAFLKESDQAVFGQGIMHDALNQAAIDALLLSLPPLITDPGVVNVENVRSGLIAVKTSVASATWKVRILGHNSTSPLNSDPPRVSDTLFLGEAEGSGSSLVHVSLLGITHAWVQPVEVSDGTLSVALGLFPYQTDNPS